MAVYILFMLSCVIAHIQGAAINLADCGSTKGCFGLPQGCVQDSEECQVAATWQPNGNKIQFELYAKTGGSNAYYGSFGILEPGSTRGMSKAVVMDCIGTSGNSFVAYSVNDESTNTPLADTTGLSVISTEFADGEVRCVFERDQTVSSNAASFPDLTAGHSYKINIAHGVATKRSNTASVEKNYHGGNKGFSENAVDFTQTAISTGSASRSVLFVKAHGSLMIIAWILMAGTAITLARYYKDMWPGKTVPVYEKPIWFSFHSLCNTLAVLATIISFILIFYFKQEWSDLAGESPTILRSHPYLGVIVTACALINPAMALFRPHPGAERRPIFNWCHWLVGTIALIAGILTVFSGLNLTLSKSFTSPWMTRLLLAFVIFAFIADVVLEITRCAGTKRKAQAEIEMNAPGEPQHKEVSNKPAASGLRNMIIGLYLLFALGTTIALIVGIAIS